jgi:hypothetical protein
MKLIAGLAISALLLGALVPVANANSYPLENPWQGEEVNLGSATVDMCVVMAEEMLLSLAKREQGDEVYSNGTLVRSRINLDPFGTGSEKYQIHIYCGLKKGLAVVHVKKSQSYWEFVQHERADAIRVLLHPYQPK